MPAPTSLFETQYKLQQSIKEKSNKKFSAAAIALIADQPPLSPTERLEIYQDAFLLRMVDTLAMDFVRLKNELTKEKYGGNNELFEKLVEQFVAEIPSRYTSIAEIGQNFPLFLKKHSDKWYELASLDWLEFLSFYTEDDDPHTLNADNLAGGIPFVLRLKASTFFFKNSDINNPQYYVSSKTDNNSVYIEEISAQDFVCLQELKTPQNLEQFHALLEKSKIDLRQAYAKIAKWFEKGLLRCIQHV